MKKRFCFVWLLIFLCACLYGCEKPQLSPLSSECALLDFADGTVSGNSVYYFAESDTQYLLLSDAVAVSEGATWTLYADILGQREIPTKVAAGEDGVLHDGSNEFFILVTAEDGLHVALYRLTVYKSFTITVRYFSFGEQIAAEECKTGYDYSAKLLPKEEGYIFVGWQDIHGTFFTEGVLTEDLNLFAYWIPSGTEI